MKGNICKTFTETFDFILQINKTDTVFQIPDDMFYIKHSPESRGLVKTLNRAFKDSTMKINIEPALENRLTIFLLFN